jgi:hypothetical protein
MGMTKTCGLIGMFGILAAASCMRDEDRATSCDREDHVGVGVAALERAAYHADAACGNPAEDYAMIGPGQWQSTGSAGTYSFVETARTPEFVQLESTDGSHVHVRLYNSYFDIFTGPEPSHWQFFSCQTGRWVA